MKKYLSIFCALAIALLLPQSCGSPANEAADQTVASIEKPRVPDWAKNAVLYEVNIRQFTPEGTFKAFEAHLPRLKEMGVDILWFMPIHPISKVKRKGSLGSPYAVADYYAVNPDYGTLDEFKELVKKIHNMGMYVIIDWVPNHTGWDHPWIEEHPDWYTHHPTADTIIHPTDRGVPTDWYDVAELNHDNPALRAELIRAMKFWIEEVGVDGFRCDTAHNVPEVFWNEMGDALYPIRPLFMLAETEDAFHRNSGNFVADYGWTFHHLMNEIAQGKKTALEIPKYLEADAKKYTQGYHIYFTSNHDENAWNGTVFERMGDAHKVMAVLAATMDGMPLIYGGQEAPLKKRLSFFDKDSIDWDGYAYAPFYQTLFDLKHRNKALWNGKDGGPVQVIHTGQDDKVFAFQREKDGDKVVVVCNLSDEMQTVRLQGDSFTGSYNNVFANSTMLLTGDMAVQLGPWDFIVLSNK